MIIRTWRLPVLALSLTMVTFLDGACRRLDSQSGEPAMRPQVSSRALKPSDVSQPDAGSTMSRPDSIMGRREQALPLSFAGLVKKVGPSVVNIFTTKLIRERVPIPLPFGGYNMFFGLRTRERLERSLGSGFIIDTEGHVLTNHHVIDGAADILIELEGVSAPARAEVIGSDPLTDIGLCRINVPNLSPAALGDSDQLEVGDWVVAIGNPFGLSHTVTVGIVSAKGRTQDDVGLGPGSAYGFIQTDASINPGNSGGPLINIRGEVVGISSAVSAQGQGIGFAIPINVARPILEQLKTKGYVARSWMGALIRDLSPKIAVEMGLPAARGAMVIDVMAGGAADRAGIKNGDVLIEIGGVAITDSSQLPWAMHATEPGEVVEVRIVRQGRLVSLPLAIESGDAPSKN